MNAYVIESGVPVPVRLAKRKYPLREMKDGDSFVVTAPEIGRVRMAISQFRLRNNIHFVTRKQTDGSYRIWRLGAVDTPATPSLTGAGE